MLSGFAFSGKAGAGRPVSGETAGRPVSQARSIRPTGKWVRSLGPWGPGLGWHFYYQRCSYHRAPLGPVLSSRTPVFSNAAGTWPSKLGSLTCDLLRELFEARLPRCGRLRARGLPSCLSTQAWGWSAGPSVPKGLAFAFACGWPRLTQSVLEPFAGGSVLLSLNLRPAARGTLAGLVPGPAGGVNPVDSPPVCRPCPSPGARWLGPGIPGQPQESPNQPPAGPTQARWPSAAQHVPGTVPCHRWPH